MPAEAALPFTAIVLAAQRDGRLDPMAIEAGVSHKCLMPIVGKPLIRHVIDALVRVPGLAGVRICIEPEAADAVRAALPAPEALGVPLEFVPAAPTITESAYSAAEGAEGAILITTGDNVNLTPDAVAQLMAPIADGADGALAVATRGAVLAAHPEGQRRFYEFADDAYSNCNLYALAGRHVLAMAEAFREGGQFAKNPRRVIKVFGLFNLLMVRFRLLTMEAATARLSKRLGFRIRTVVLQDGAHAIDVDNPRTYRIAEAVLLAKAAAAGG